MRRVFARAAVVALFVVLPACPWASPQPPGPGPIWESGASTSFIVLADALRAQWLWVARRGEVRVEPLSVTGEVLQVERDRVLVFDYRDEASRARDLAKIRDDLPRDHAWRVAARVWTDDTAIVVYEGVDEAIVAALTEALGKPRTL